MASDSDIAVKIKSVKAAIDKTPDGLRRDEAQKHQQAAGMAHLADRYGEANKELDAAARALKEPSAVEMSLGRPFVR